MNTDEVEGWDDWRRPTTVREVWPLALLTLAPVLGVALVVRLVSRALGA